MRYLLRQWALLSVVVTAGCLMSACSEHDVTAPTLRSPRARPDLIAPGGSGLPTPNETWSSFFTPPANSSSQSIAAITPVEIGSISDSTWIVVNVNGSITEVWNPECAYVPP